MRDYELVVLHGNKTRCQHLDDDGNRCRKTAKFRKGYFGDRQTMGDSADWVVVELCEQHGRKIFDVPEDLSRITVLVRR